MSSDVTDFAGGLSALALELPLIRRARIMERCESLSMIAPVSPDPDEVECAYRAIEIFEPTSVLIRARRPNKFSPPFESFGGWDALSKHPIWECEQWLRSMKEIMTRSGAYAHLPPVPDLPKYLAENYEKLSDVEQLDIEDVIAHVELAAKMIYHHLLADICETTEASSAPSSSGKSEPAKA